ncbi:hypothetical protein ACJX0J_033973, partial [Zea mays]
FSSIARMVIQLITQWTETIGIFNDPIATGEGDSGAFPCANEGRGVDRLPIEYHAKIRSGFRFFLFFSQT